MNRFSVDTYRTLVYCEEKKYALGVLIKITNEQKTTYITCPPIMDIVHGIVLGFISEETGIPTGDLEDKIGIKNHF